MLKTISNFITSKSLPAGRQAIGQIFNLGKKTVEWKKVNELKPGMKIAVTDGYSHERPQGVEWDEIVSIKSVGQEQVYDIEVEGTHNFVGNDIVAHNTYISGNLGIGTTSATQKLDVVGNLQFSQALLPNGSSGTTGQFLISQGTSAPIWTSTVGASTVPFSGITSGTNTTAAMIVDTGASINYANSGTINASSLIGGTWAIPGTIGSTTPNTGAFTTLSTTGNVGIGVTGAGISNLLTINQSASTTAATVGTYGIDLQDQGSHRLTIGGDANYAYIQTWNSKPLQINNQGNNVLFNSGGGSVGIGTTGPDAKLDSLATTEQLRLSYTDGSVYSSHTVNSSGDLTIDNTGTQTIIADDLAVNGATSADITTTTTTATVFDTTATTLSLGGAATTALNLGNGSGNYTAINLGSGAGTHVINIAGTGATAADTINIGTGGTGADTINLGSNASTTALNYTSGTGAQTFTSSVISGTNASSAFVFADNALTTGTGMYLTSTSLTSGKLFDVSSILTGTAFTGKLANIDWSPSGSTNIYNTGDLLRINTGQYAQGVNLLNITDNGSSIFSVSQTAITNAVPASFTSAGDVSLAYDLLFTNQTSSYLKSNGPLYLTAGESWESNDLTLQTYNSGNIILNSANLWADGSNVGIGTTSPTALLHLGIGSTATIGLKITLASGATANAFEINSSSGVGGDKFLIKANGNVGIGTTSPTYQLQTTGTLGIGSTAYFASTVGIGTTAPVYPLAIYASSIPALQLISSTTGATSTDGFTLGMSSDDVYLNQRENKDMLFYTNGAFAAIIKASGNVGIGTTNPAAKLDVVGDMYIGSGATRWRIFNTNQMATANNCDTVTGGAVDAICWDSNDDLGTSEMRLQPSGALTHTGALASSTDADIAEQIEVDDPSIIPGDILVATTMLADDGRDIYKRAQASISRYAYQTSIIGAVSTSPGILIAIRNAMTLPEANYAVDDTRRALAIAGRIPVNIAPDSPRIQVGDYLTSSNTPGKAMKATRAGTTVGKALENWEPNSGKTSILVFLNVSWYDPDVYFTATGDLHINQNAQGDYAVQNTNGQTITDRISTFASSFIANLTAGIINADKLISPIAEIDTLRVKDNLLSPLATIDELVVTNASISGTLYATEISSPTIDSLNTKYSILDTNYATASAILAAIKAKYSDFDALNNPNVANNPLDTTNLSGQNATVSGSISLDTSYSILNTVVADTLLVNTSLISNSINSNDTALYIQPTGNLPINLLAGLMTLTPDGKVVVNGDLTVTGTLLAHNSKFMNLESDIATISGTLYADKSEISNLKSQIITTNDLIIASGAIASASASPSATSSATLASNASIGTGTIASGSAEVKIENSKIENSTYIYLTPISDTANQVLYLKNKTSCEPSTVNCVPSFTVSITDPVARDIKFNYWLIQTK